MTTLLAILLPHKLKPVPPPALVDFPSADLFPLPAEEWGRPQLDWPNDKDKESELSGAAFEDEILKQFQLSGFKVEEELQPEAPA